MAIDTIKVKGQKEPIDKAEFIKKWVDHARELVPLGWADYDKFKQILKLTEELANARFEQVGKKQTTKEEA